MPWELFERAAPGYDAWYDTRRGQRVERAERALLSELLALFPGAESLLEIGCGTGRFCGWLAGAFRVLGIDRSPAMLAEMRARHPSIPVLLADAHQLPLPPASVDMVLFVTALEFLEEPATALGEAVRVARRGVVMIALNRWSAGGLSRRVGAQSRSPVLGQARDLSLLPLRTMVKEAAGSRVIGLSWASALFPAGLWAVRGRLPLGDVLGMAVVLAEPTRDLASPMSRVVARRAPRRALRPRPCTAFGPCKAAFRGAGVRRLPCSEMPAHAWSRI
jgi:SAM-dependent methyltransferase